MAISNEVCWGNTMPSKMTPLIQVDLLQKGRITEKDMSASGIKFLRQFQAVAKEKELITQ